MVAIFAVETTVPPPGGSAKVLLVVSTLGPTVNVFVPFCSVIVAYPDPASVNASEGTVPPGAASVKAATDPVVVIDCPEVLVF